MVRGLGWASKASATTQTAPRGKVFHERVKGKLIAFTSITKKQGKLQAGILANDTTIRGIPLKKVATVEFDVRGNLVAFTVLEKVSVDGYWLSAQNPVNNSRGTNASLHPNGKLARGVLSTNPQARDGRTKIGSHALAPGSTVSLTSKGVPTDIDAKAGSTINGTYKLELDAFLWCDTEGNSPEVAAWQEKAATRRKA